MDMFSGATLGLVAVMYWQIVQASIAYSRMERKLDALLEQSGVDLSQLATQEALEAQRLAPQRRLLMRLALLGLVLGAALTGLLFVLRLVARVISPRRSLRVHHSVLL